MLVLVLVIAVVIVIVIFWYISLVDMVVIVAVVVRKFWYVGLMMDAVRWKTRFATFRNIIITLYNIHVHNCFSGFYFD